MREILMINPARKKRTRKTKRAKTAKKRVTRRRVATKGVKPMARRKRRSTRRRAASPARTYTRRPVRRRRRRNPSSRTRRAASRVRSSLAGMNIKTALKNVPLTMIGMFAARWAAKRFGAAASEFDAGTWDWASYLKGSLGAFAGGFLMQMIKPGSGQKVLEGGISLMAYKVIENELIPKSEWAVSQFGAEDDTNYFPSEYVQTDEAGTPYLLGQDNQWYPVDERHRMMGDVLEPPGRLGGAYEDAYFGDTLEPPGRLGAEDPFARAFFG